MYCNFSSWATVVDTSFKVHIHSFVKTWVLFTHKCFMPSLFEIGSVVFEMTLKVVNVLIFTIYVKLIDDNVPLEKDTAFHLKQSWIPFIQEGFVVKLVQWFWSFLKVLHLFSLCRYYLPFEKGYDIWTNLNSVCLPARDALC